MKSIHALLSVFAFGLAGSAVAGGGAYPVDEPAADSGKSRAEVIAEWQEAKRLGLLTISEAGVPESTPRQEAQIAEAGRRATDDERFAESTPSAAPDAPQPSLAASESRRRIMRM